MGMEACPCCGNLTIPGGEDSVAYICPVCFWEIDPFQKSEEEPSDSNHGLTLPEARENYRRYGAVKKSLAQYCRAATIEEHPKKQ